MYTSTRKKLNINEQECIVKGISDDGGLFICDQFEGFEINQDFVNLSYKELSCKILKFYFKNFSDVEIQNIIENSYGKHNFNEQIVDLKSFNELSFLELYHGPTMAFKDMALTVLPNLMVTSKKKLNNSKKTLIITATSGDTGGACLSGFKNNDDTKIIVLYPTKGVSAFQESQMHYYTSNNAYAIAINGNFDDCQTLVKKVFTSTKDLTNIELSSANSINIGRLVPQVIYYFYSYFDLIRKNEIKFGDKINFVVPTGNFGNILACFLAKKMGLFIDKIVCASNENNVLTDFFNTLVYDKNREFYLTNSPAMDILISSNLERLLYLASNNDELLISSLMDDLKNKGKFVFPKDLKNNLSDFIAYYINKEDTIKYIDKCFKENDYLIDPHTAVAYGSYLNLKDKLNGKTVVVSTASPFKFIESVNEIFNFNDKGIDLVEKISKASHFNIPNVLYEIYNKKVNKIIWEKDEMEINLRKLIGEIDESC